MLRKSIYGKIKHTKIEKLLSKKRCNTLNKLRASYFDYCIYKEIHNRPPPLTCCQFFSAYLYHDHPYIFDYFLPVDEHEMFSLPPFLNHIHMANNYNKNHGQSRISASNKTLSLVSSIVPRSSKKEVARHVSFIGHGTVKVGMKKKHMY